MVEHVSETPERAEAQAEAEPPKRHATLQSSASVEHTTPLDIVERVVATLGAIDLDPCAELARAVPARKHFTAEEDGLASSATWRGRVYMNPPYGRAVAAWTTRFCQAYTAGEMHAGVALVAARTDTRWFRQLYRFPVCLLHGRLRFGDAANLAPFPSALVYAGPDIRRFHAAMMDIGTLVAASQLWRTYPRVERAGVVWSEV